MIEKNLPEAKEILRDQKTEIHALLIHADQQEDIRSAIVFVKESRRLISVPILIYADEETPADHFACLGENVIDCMTRPYVSHIVKNRLANVIAFTDSMTFYEIEKYLNSFPPTFFSKTM